MLLVSLLAVRVADSVLPGSLNQWGIVPRTESGAVGILLAPLLHGGWGHLLANSVPLAVLVTLLGSDARYRPGWALAGLWLGSGLGTWLIGRPGTVHVGASGLIYGLVAYLVVAGWRLREWRAALVAAGVLAFYGGSLLFAVLPWANGTGVSWEGHLSGAFSGVVLGRGLPRTGRFENKRPGLEPP